MGIFDKAKEVAGDHREHTNDQAHRANRDRDDDRTPTQVFGGGDPVDQRPSSSPSEHQDLTEDGVRDLPGAGDSSGSR